MILAEQSVDTSCAVWKPGWSDVWSAPMARFNVFSAIKAGTAHRGGFYKLNSSGVDAKDFGIIWDTGASQTVSFDKADFLTGIEYFERRVVQQALLKGYRYSEKGWCDGRYPLTMAVPTR
jgi:hypothetical protein